jgi:hypothetical protein
MRVMGVLGIMGTGGLGACLEAATTNCHPACAALLAGLLWNIKNLLAGTNAFLADERFAGLFRGRI